MMNPRQPLIYTDGGPWVEHDQVCYVCRQRSAVLDLNNGVFYPCWVCELDGWRLAKKRHRVRRWLERRMPTRYGQSSAR